MVGTQHMAARPLRRRRPEVPHRVQQVLRVLHPQVVVRDLKQNHREFVRLLSEPYIHLSSARSIYRNTTVAFVLQLLVMYYLARPPSTRKLHYLC